jgi:hypothetical protein
MRYRCHDPLIRMCVCRVNPSSHTISMCLPWLSTRSMTRPRAGCGPTRRGASKVTVGLPTSAMRNAAAALWIVSPSGTTSHYAPLPNGGCDARGSVEIMTDGTGGAGRDANPNGRSHRSRSSRSRPRSRSSRSSRAGATRPCAARSIAALPR